MHIFLKKFTNIKFIDDGGWHFTCIKTRRYSYEIAFFRSLDYENAGISLEQLKSKILERKVLYDHSKDKTNQNKWFSEQTLEQVKLDTLPAFVRNNNVKFQDWLD